MAKSKKLQPAVVMVDWSDTEGLLAGLKAELAKHGVVLQAWDMGSDDVIVSVHSQPIRSTAATLATWGELKSEDGDALPRVHEVKLPKYVK